MGHVTGIDGVLLRADDPVRLGRWYAERLGVGARSDAHEASSPVPSAVVLTPTAGDGTRDWAVSFQVDDLDALVADLTHAGVEVHFEGPTTATLTDPEGNAVRLVGPTTCPPPDAAGTAALVDGDGDGDDGATAPARRWTRWLPLLVVLAAGAAAVVALRPDGGDTTPEPAPSSLAVGPTAEATEGTRRPQVLELRSGLLPTGADWEIFARGYGTVLRIEPGRGRVTRTPLPGRAASGSTALLVGTESVLLPTADGEAAYVVRDGEPASRVSLPTGGTGAVFPGPRQGTLWVQRAADSPLPLSLLNFDGELIGRSITSAPAGFYPTASDGGDGLFGSATGGVYDVTPDGARRVTTGALVATGPTHLLAEECDVRGSCSSVVIDSATGARRTLSSVATGPHAGLGATAPGGAFAATLSSADGYTSRLQLLNLRDGTAETTGVTVDTNGGERAPLAWSPEGRWLFFPSGGRLLAYDVYAGYPVALPVPVGTATSIDQVAIRRAP